MFSQCAGDWLQRHRVANTVDFYGRFDSSISPISMELGMSHEQRDSEGINPITKMAAEYMCQVGR